MSQYTAVNASNQIIDNTSISNSTTATTSKYASGEFFEFLWRTAGVQAVGLFVVAYFLYGYQPGIGASADALATFYSSNSTRILIAGIFGGMTVLNLMWFAAALRTALASEGRDGWGSAATAASAAFGGLCVLFLTIVSVLTFSIAGSGNQTLLSALNDFSWALVVLSSFPRAMLIMSGAFGFWRASMISNGVFAIGVAAVVLSLLGGMTWMSSGFFAPDGAYTRFVAPFILVAWIFAVTGVLFKRGKAHGTGW